MFTQNDIQRIPLLSNLSEEACLQLLEGAAELHVHPGDWIAQEGDPPAFFLVFSGEIAVLKAYDGREEQLRVHQPGAYFGEVPLLLDTVFFASFRALTPARLARLEPDAFRQLLSGCPPIKAELQKSLSERLHGVAQASARRKFEGPQLIGHRWSADSHRLKDFLARNRVTYRWIDADSQEDGRKAAGECGLPLPLVQLADGTVLSNPTALELAAKVGLRTEITSPFYDFAIVGAGPAGLAAAVYGASEGLRTLLIEREAPGGQAGTSSRIENYLGFPNGVSGDELARRAVSQAEKFGVEILSARGATSLRTDGSYRVVGLAAGTGMAEVSAHAVLVATGVSYRKLSVPGIDRLVGAGVYYGAARTEAMGCRGADVHLVGAGNSAGQAALYFSEYANHVIVLVRGADLETSMSSYLITQLKARENIEVRFHTEVAEAHGEHHLEQLTLVSGQGSEAKRETVATGGLFVFIGAQPATEWLDDAVQRDKFGFLLCGADLMAEGRRPASWSLTRDPFLSETSLPGVFAAGDVRHGSIKRVAAGVGEGSMTVAFVHEYLREV